MRFGKDPSSGRSRSAAVATKFWKVEWVAIHLETERLQEGVVEGARRVAETGRWSESRPGQAKEPEVRAEAFRSTSSIVGKSV